MRVQGKCHCGEIAFTAEVDPKNVGICHCTDCQVLTGSPYRVSVTAKDRSFELLKGKPKIYIKTAEDGTSRAQAFCPSCGTPIYAAGVEANPTYNLRLGCLEQRAELPPQRQIWCRSAIPWSANISGLPKLEMD